MARGFRIANELLITGLPIRIGRLGTPPTKVKKVPSPFIVTAEVRAGVVPRWPNEVEAEDYYRRNNSAALPW